MRIWIYHKSTAFIKPLSANGYFVCGRVYFKNQRGSLVGFQNLLPIMLVPLGRQNAEMFNIKSPPNIPIQNFTHKFPVVANNIKMVGILL